ncbi:NERD domain-containing protein [uncultured Enterococcus sp.]|uniref:NERD domain-containing protein n=1 Tax=uncultured Enterococcus sp. TaxID=167972 RepID=UPI002AA6D53E|nr:NERD domain-containing protein [uncultured Enterococcus sp.]
MKQIIENNRNAFLDRVYEENKENCQRFIDILKATGVDINCYGAKKFKLKGIKYLQAFTEGESNRKLVEAYQTEVKILNNLLEQCTERLNEFISTINLEQSIEEFLIFLELTLTNVDLEFEQNKLDEFNIEELEITRDVVLFFSGKILSFLLFTIKNNKLEFFSTNRTYGDKKIESYNKLMFLYQEYDTLVDAVDTWKYYDLSIYNESPVKIDFNDELFDSSVVISNYRYLGYLDSMEREFMNNELGRVNDDTNKMFKRKIFRIQTEMLEGECYHFLGKNSQDKLILGVKLSEWIQIINYLREYSFRYSEKRNEKNLIKSLSKLCIVKDRKEWIKCIRKNTYSISEIVISTVIDHLTFRHTDEYNSKDLVDCPFVEIENKLVILPSILKTMRTFSSIISSVSHFKKNNGDIAIKGDAFAERVKELLQRTLNVPVEIIANKRDYENKSTGDLDIVFVLEDELFIFECKAFNQPYTIREHAKVNKKIYESVKQINRNVKRLTENREIIDQRFNIDSKKVLRNINKIVLTSSCIGHSEKVEGVYIIDEAMLNAFLYRNPPQYTIYSRQQEDKSYPINKSEIYMGDITVQKLVTFFETTPSLQAIKAMINKREGDTFPNVVYSRFQKDFYSKYTFTNNEDSFKELIEKNRIAFEKSQRNQRSVYKNIMKDFL